LITILYLEDKLTLRGGLYCPHYRCDVCGEVIKDYGNYEYMVALSDDRPVNQVYTVHKECSDPLRSVLTLPDKHLWHSSELSSLGLSLQENLINTDYKIDDMLFMLMKESGFGVPMRCDELPDSPGFFCYYNNGALVYENYAKNISGSVGRDTFYEDHHEVWIAKTDRPASECRKKAKAYRLLFNID